MPPPSEETAQQKRWIAEQEALSGQVQIPAQGYQPQTGDIVLGLDIQYQGDIAHVAGALSRWQGDTLGTFAGVCDVEAPYIPGLFCFREGPPLLALVHALQEAGQPTPDVILVDGHGLAHPRRFGAACWMGLATGIPTVGCAKDTLLRFEGELAEAKGSTLDVLLEEEVVGVVLRRIAKVRPVYVSPGHLISVQGATQMVLSLPSKYRVPDPVRHADHAARERSKGNTPGTWQDLGELPLIPAPWE